MADCVRFHNLGEVVRDALQRGMIEVSLKGWPGLNCRCPDPLALKGNITPEGVMSCAGCGTQIEPCLDGAS